MECAADNRSAKKSTDNLVIPPNTWRPGEGYPDTAHPFHRRAIEHRDKILDYLIDLLKLFAIDKRAASAGILCVIDGALSTRMLYGTSKEIPLLSSAEAVLKSFQSARNQRRR